jgi:hypothetical protein
MDILSKIVKYAYQELETLDKESNEYKTSKRIVDGINVFNKTHRINENISNLKEKASNIISDLFSKSSVPQVKESILVKTETSGYITLTNVYLPSLSNNGTTVNFDKETNILTIHATSLDENIIELYNIDKTGIIKIDIPYLSDNTNKPFDSVYAITDGVLQVKVFYNAPSIVDTMSSLASKASSKLKSLFN